MTRTAKTPRLMAHIGEPFVEIHPEDARAIGVAAADLAEIESEHGRAVLRVVVTERQRLGSLFAPMHWTDQYSAIGASRRPRLLRGRSRFRPTGAEDRGGVSKALRRGMARVRRGARANRDGGGRLFFACARARRLEGGTRGSAAPDDWTAFARQTLGLDDDAEMVAYHDAAAGQRRFVAFVGESFAGALFVARQPVAAARAWLAERLGAPIAPEDRLKLLAGRPGAEARDRGPTVCACFDVGRNEIVEAVTQGMRDGRRDRRAPQGRHELRLLRQRNRPARWRRSEPPSPSRVTPKPPAALPLPFADSAPSGSCHRPD